MELLTLDSNFQPTRLVEDWESLVWSERYSKAGDFQYKSSNIAGSMALFPLESYVTLRESTVPMVVEGYLIEKPANSAPMITVVGRSFEACALERRWATFNAPGVASKSTWIMAANSPSDAAYKAMRVVLGDLARYQSSTLVLNAQSPVVAEDAIPEIDLTLPADYSTATANNYEIKFGKLYDTVMELLALNNRGLKATRPSSSGTQTSIEVYNGADLTNTVVFDARFDQIDSAKYLLSNQGSTNVGYVYGAPGTTPSAKVLKNSGPGYVEPSGLARRVLGLDLTSDAATANSLPALTTRGLIELYKNNPTALFDGEVAYQVAAGYNKTYFLGDILKLVGEYGLSQNVRVAEFIRTSDSTGEKAYPAFETVTS